MMEFFTGHRTVKEAEEAVKRGQAGH